MSKINISKKDLLKQTALFNLSEFDGIIAISKRGIKIAELLSQKYAVKIYDIENDKKKYDIPNKKILLVDDTSNSGYTINIAKSKILNADVKTFVIAGQADYSIYKISACISISNNKFNFINKLTNNKIGYWFVGLFAFLWVFFRSGLNPKRAAYPCQQAAIPIASTWVISTLAFFGGTFFAKRVKRFSTVIVVSVGLLWFVGNASGKFNYNSRTEIGNRDNISLPSWVSENPISQIFVIDSIQTSLGSLVNGNSSVPDEYLSDPAIDDLIEQMHLNGLNFYKTIATPSGIIGSDNVVILKCNFQWENRSGTNTDRIKGVINRILHHPEGFTGEILVIDNTQTTQLPINYDDNNSDDQNQSILSVVNTFKDKGYPVNIMNWVVLKNHTVNEYNTGDLSDGYLWLPDEGKITYPKFKTPITQKYLSLRYGIWDNDLQEYNHDAMKIINMPVLKAHVVAGATIGLKNWVGVLTTEDAVNRYGPNDAMHNDYFFGEYNLIPKVLTATYPDLTIVDATWTNSMNHNERSDYSTGGLFDEFDPARLINTKILVASTDPCAASWYAAKYVMTPIAYFPDRTDPDRPDSLCQDFLNPYGWKTIYYAKFLRNSVNYLRNISGLDCTTDSTEISVFYHANTPNSIVNNSLKIKNFKLSQNFPNPFNPTTTIRYDFKNLKFKSAKIIVYNSSGQKIWSSKPLSSNTNHCTFNGSKFNSGIYYYSLIIDGKKICTKKMILIK